MIKKIISKIFILAFFLFSFNVNASTVFFNSTSNKLSVSEVFRVDFLINTEGKNINAFESNIIFDDNLLELQKLYAGNYTVDFWVKSPRSQSNKIFFSGITPGGFNGENGKIMSALFVAKKPGLTIIEIENSSSKFLLNDDNGTEDNFKSNNLLLQIVDSKQEVVDNNKPIDTLPIINNTENNPAIEITKDTTRPEEFTVKIIKENKIGDGKFSIIFNAQDKDSGINYYEVKEGDEEFKKIESPYILKNQDLTKEIQVKAVDLEGNYRIQKIGPLIINETRVEINYVIIIFSLLFIIFVLILLEIYLNRRKKLKNEKNNNIQ